VSTQSSEALYEDSDDRPQSERELDAYRAAVQHLDEDDLIHGGCSRLPYEGSALLELLRLELAYPVEDIDRAHVHPDLAQRVTLQCLRALRASIDEQAGVYQVVGGR
jgi:hypothetical protein